MVRSAPKQQVHGSHADDDERTVLSPDITNDDDELNGGVISNGYQYHGTDARGKAKTITEPVAIDSLVQQIRYATGDWPRIANGAMFVRGVNGDVDWLEKTENYYGYLHTVKPVRWHGGQMFVTRAEARAEHMRHAPRYQAIEPYPHEPRLKSHYYLCDNIEPGDGTHLGRLLDFFSPETPIDRDLLQAALMTMCWGGPGGSRPIFMILADGRGHGKTKTAEYLSSVFGGVMSFSITDRAKDIKERLLTPEALSKRVCILDNVKTTKVSSGDIEALITASEISGKRMYCGEASRPNTITWFITMNGASLSKDMAQRSIPIRLKRPVYSGDWDRQVTTFIENNRLQIIADIVAAIRGPAHKLNRYTRWGMWERAIFEKLPEPNEAQQVIFERQAGVDTDAEEASMVDQFFADRLRELHYDVNKAKVFIPSPLAVEWLVRATGRQATVVGGSRYINQQIAEGSLPRLVKSAGNTNGRGYLWQGTESLGSPIDTQIKRKIAHSAKTADGEYILTQANNNWD